MIDYRIIRRIERHGCITANGERIYGTAALLYVLHRPISEIRPEELKRGNELIKKLLSA